MRAPRQGGLLFSVHSKRGTCPQLALEVPSFKSVKTFKDKTCQLLAVEVLSFESGKKSKNFDQTYQQRGPMLQAWKNVRFNNKNVSKTD